MPPAASTPDMREALVRAALTVLRRDGAAALTVRSITAEAGCSTTGVYTYFGGKNGLVDAIFRDGFASFDEAVDPHLGVGDVLGTGHAYRRWALDHPTQYMVMFGRAVPDYAPSDEAITRALESFTKLAAGVRRSGVTDDAHVDERAYRLFATLHGYVMLEMAAMTPPTIPPAGELFERALAELVRPDAPPPRTTRARA